jgi:hypothetical protein
MRKGRGSGSRGARFSGMENESPGNLGDENLQEDSGNSEIGNPAGESPQKSQAPPKKPVKAVARDTAQIEYLIHQSTLGVHFLFDRKEVARVMMTPTEEKDFFTLKNMERVQSLLSRFLEKPTIMDKERFLKALNVRERDLLIRAYFHLVENAIQSNFELKH